MAAKTASQASKSKIVSRPVAELSHTKDEPTPVPTGPPRPPSLKAAPERNIIDKMECPRCGYAVTKMAINNTNYHVCTGNYAEPELCSWHQELDKEGNPIAAAAGGDDW